MSSRRSPASILAPLRRGSPPRPAVSSPAGRRAGGLSLGLTLLGALGSGWCLISTGRALGALLRSSSAAGLLAQALTAAALSAVCQLLAQRVARGLDPTSGRSRWNRAVAALADVLLKEMGESASQYGDEL